MSVDQATVRRVAKLARIKVKEENVERLAGELNSILRWIEQLNEVNVEGVEKLPRVDIVYAHAGMDGSLIDAAVKAGAKGIVVAGVGNGNMTKAALSALVKHAKKGVVCVRSSRVPSGRVSRNVEVDDDATGTVASEELNPAKARVLLKLALLSKREPADVQQLFREY